MLQHTALKIKPSRNSFIPNVFLLVKYLNPWKMLWSLQSLWRESNLLNNTDAIPLTSIKLYIALYIPACENLLYLERNEVLDT